MKKCKLLKQQMRKIIKLPLKTQMLILILAILCVLYSFYLNEDFYVKVFAVYIIFTFIIPLILANIHYFINKKKKGVINYAKAVIKNKTVTDGNNCNDVLFNETNKIKESKGAMESKINSKNLNEVMTTDYFDRLDVTDIEYEDVRGLFNYLLKNKFLERKQIIGFKNLINRHLKDNILHYQGFEFNSDAHEIYIKLKNSHLSEDDYIMFYIYLNAIYSNRKCNLKKEDVCIDETTKIKEKQAEELLFSLKNSMGYIRDKDIPKMINVFGKDFKIIVDFFTSGRKEMSLYELQNLDEELDEDIRRVFIASNVYKSLFD